MIDQTDAVAAEYDRIVREDIELFRQTAEEYLAGSLSDNEFRAMRLRRGIYGQRQPGVQMVRTKIPGGLLTAPQLTQLANLADEFSTGRAHLTTRQNLQFHFVPLRSVPDMLHKLADFRLTTREACYNTVRNVTGCVNAGLHPDEVFDVRPYAQRVALAFLHKELTDSMPRKFKITFCGCGHDCTAAAINDIGLKAVIRDGKRGFQMVIGGGLGSLPHEARLLEEFVPEEHLVQKCEAMIRVFNQHGNRANKMKARFKFIIRERGFDWVRETIEREFQDILANGGIPLPERVPEGFGGFVSEPPALGQGKELPVVGNAIDPKYDRWLETNVREQKQPGYASVIVRADQGNLTSDQMRGLAKLSSDAADGFFRVTIDQNLMMAYVPLTRLKPVYAALKALGLNGAGANEIEDVTTCPGAYTCNLGLTKSMNLGAELSAMVSTETDPEIRKLLIKISGCPNSCGQHWIADFGFYGNARKIEGREVPYYQMLLGGGYDHDGLMRFGFAVQSLPARLIPEAVKRVINHYKGDRKTGETFRDYVLRHKVEFFRGMTADLTKPPAGVDEMFRDWGDDTAYSLSLGRGECAS